MQSQDVERALLGAVLIGGRETLATIERIVGPDDFATEADRFIFEAAQALAESGTAIDLITVQSELEREQRLGKAGGPIYVASLLDKVEDPDSADSYARIVRESAAKKRLLRQTELLSRALSNGSGLSDIHAIASALANAAAQAIPRRELAPDERPVFDVASILSRSKAGGPRYATGLAPLDEILRPRADPTRAGLQTGRVVAFCGAPYQGKSLLADQLALSMAKHGMRVVMLVDDEPREDAAERIGQGLGYRHAELNREYPDTIRELRASVAEAGIDLQIVPDPDSDGPRETIESAAERLLSKSNAIGHVLLVDSIHSSRSASEHDDDPPRVSIERRIGAFKALRRRGVLVLFTSEVSRAAYASRDVSQRTQPLAAGAESRTIEYGSDLMLFLSEGEDETVHVEVPKNRIARKKGSFDMRLDPGPARFHGVGEGVMDETRKAQEEGRLLPIEDRIVQVILEHGDFMTGRAIERVASDPVEKFASRGDTRAAIRSALAKGKLVKREAPGKAGGGGWVYGPPSDGQKKGEI